jgi:hypothetical protein
MAVYEDDMYEDGMIVLCLSCKPCFAIIYYELLLIHGYL